MQDPVKGDRFYTIVFEYEGLTSIPQFFAASPADAVDRWFAEIGDGTAYGLTAKQKRKLLSAYADRDEPELEVSRVRGVSGVWCTTVFGDPEVAYYNIVKSVPPVG